ncbi:MAG: preprotein translocase YidC subunit, partial [Neobacillus sp.]|nr:preprotein translocase YidC subunit [Neobacillus sp.]
MDVLGVDDLGASGALAIVDLVKNSQYTALFADAVPSQVIQSILQFDTSFMGLDLSLVPTLLTSLVIIPILSTISAFVLCLIQNKENVLQQEQGAWSKWGMTVFLVLFSLYFTFVVPAGVGIYWICSNVFAIVQIYILNWIYNPKKYIDYEYLAASKEANRILMESKKLKKLEEKEFAPREKADYKRFLDTEGKRLVFYSERSGFYKYFENVIKEILTRSDITIHYVTSDPNDAIFNRDEEQIIPYYIGEKKLISLFMKMDTDIVVMTMPDLNNYHIKRSLVRKNIEYIFMPHWLTSVSMVVRKGALDHFDTVFCVGPHWVEEIRATESVYGLKAKWLIECGYGVIENLVDMYQGMNINQQEKPQILIAPSWQEDNIMDSCIDELLESLLNGRYRIMVRPHPEYIKRYRSKMEKFQEQYKNKMGEDFVLQLDFSSNRTVFESDLVITDWSTVAHEFSYTTKKPSLFIDTKMKVMNPEYETIGITPIDISLRNAIGTSIKITEIGNAAEKVDELLKGPGQYKERITAIVDQYVYPLGKSGEIGAKYILAKLMK